MNGIILIDKPIDWTSHDVVGKLRGILHEKRIGHSGTLDPMATGLLVVFVGRATRAVEFAEADTKEYIAGLRLGISTDTQDITGTVISRSELIPSKKELFEVLSRFTGEISQLPPMYSAIKLGGKKLYELARRGETVERKPRTVTVSSIQTIGEENGDHILKVSCSKGTYIRTLCSDIGDALGCGGCMSSLRRTRAGVFSLDDAHTLDEVIKLAAQGGAQELLLPVDSLFPGLPSITAARAAEKKLRCGNEIKCPVPDGEYRVYSETGEFLLLGKVSSGIMKTIKSFFEVKNE